MMPTSTLDILVPVFNERESLNLLLARLLAAFTPTALANAGLSSARIVFVDDGSTDGSADFLAEKIRAGLPALLVRLSRNFGHQAALQAGFDHTEADWVAVIDADLQDPPELLPPMLAKARAGYDVVYGQRVSRRGNWAKRLVYHTYYRLLALLADVPVPLDAGDFCVIHRRVLVALKALPERHRFHRGLRAWIGFRQAAYPYDRPARARGKSKYSLLGLFELGASGITSMSVGPLRAIQAAASVCMVAPAVYGALLVGRHFQAGSPGLASAGLPRMRIAVCAILLINSLCVCILSMYIKYIYIEVKQRPLYVVMDKISIPAEPLASTSGPARVSSAER